MKVLVAPDKFKGSLSATAAAGAMARGWQQGWGGACEVVQAPIADGGEGFAEVFQLALGGEWREHEVQDPLGRPVPARLVWVPEQRVAVLEMSAASGLWRLQPGEQSPLEAHTFGTGQLLRQAMELGAEKILVGLGGSATTDGGTGMAAALGFRFLDEAGEILPLGPRHLHRLHRMERPEALPLPVIIGACDVTNPLLGPRGTAHVFAPQKGADAGAVTDLENALSRLADVVRRDLRMDERETPGAGAAGGFGFGLLSFCGARLQSGFDLVAETLALSAKIAACDLVITGEGRLDSQTLEGKGPGGVALLARRAGKPVLALAGSLEATAVGELYDWAFPIVDARVPLERAMAEAEAFLHAAAARAADRLRRGELHSARWSPALHP